MFIYLVSILDHMSYLWRRTRDEDKKEFLYEYACDMVKRAYVEEMITDYEQKALVQYIGKHFI